MLRSTLAVSLLLGAVAARNTPTNASPHAASQVPGAAFDRIAIIWLENTDYSKAAGDPNLKWLASQGVTLTNYFGVTHPSQCNYVAAIGGDNFGLDNDAFTAISSNVATVIDLLEDKGISWAEYEEDMPYTGFTEMAWVNQDTQANDYVRKHNPAVIFDSVAKNPDRLARTKNLTAFYSDLENNALPQWMFITPNMTSDGHDSSVTTAGLWTRNFVQPLMSDARFMKKTLVLITFDESHSYKKQNRVLAILLGDAVPKSLVGTTDNTFYDHYSEIATVEANWKLSTLGRWDVGANVFSFVAKLTGDVLRPWTAATGAQPTVFLNESYAGPYNSGNTSVPFPVPKLDSVVNGRSVLQSIQDTWRNSGVNTIYNTGVEIPDGIRLPAGY